jgi:hypothetical protein
VAGSSWRKLYTFGRLSILSPTQYGFRKEKGTRDCLADTSTSFEMKKQTVSAFLDKSRAYDNVLIDVLCPIYVEPAVV